MAEPNATFVPDSAIARTHGQKMAENENWRGINPNLDPNIFHKPTRTVWVYSVVDQRPRPLIRDNPPLIRRLNIPFLKPGERYTLVTSFGDPVVQHDLDLNGQKIGIPTPAIKVAQDVVYPENLSMDQDYQLKPENVYAEGNNYGNLGVFWSLNNPPTDEEIAKAVARKERYYRVKLEQARVVGNANPAKLDEFLTFDHHVAAEYFGEEFPWHKTSKKPDNCENCGEPVRQGAAFHRSVDGILCVRDWKRAVEAGVKTYDQVPQEKRWRTVGRPPKVEETA